MEKINQYLKIEFEKEKEKLNKEFEQKKAALIKLWEEKINQIKRQHEQTLQTKKDMVIKIASDLAEQKFLSQLNLKKAQLWQSFAQDALRILKEFDFQTKQKITSLLIESLKRKVQVEPQGIFKAAQTSINLLKQSFPQSNMQEDPNLILGFYYYDDGVEVDATADAIIKKYIKQYEY